MDESVAKLSTKGSVQRRTGGHSEEERLSQAKSSFALLLERSQTASVRYKPVPFSKKRLRSASKNFRGAVARFVYQIVFGDVVTHVNNALKERCIR